MPIKYPYKRHYYSLGYPRPRPDRLTVTASFHSIGLYVGEILTTAFSMAQAFVVLMTPDEHVVLRPELRKGGRDGDKALQSRPNVILEAGMVLAKDEARTIVVSVGPVRGMSDLDGRHVLYLNNTAQRRNDLVQRLKVAGCHPKTDGTDWIGLGDFER